MKSLFSFLIIVIISFTATAQWSSERVDNAFDPPYVISYNKNVQGTAMLKLEYYDEAVSFYMTNNDDYFCGEAAFVELSFNVNGTWVKYEKNVYLYNNHTLFLEDDLENSEMLSAFKEASSFKIRITDLECTGQTIYTFSMTGSTNAFIKTKNQ